MMATLKLSTEDYVHYSLKLADYTFIERDRWQPAQILDQAMYTVRPPMAFGGHTLFLARSSRPYVTLRAIRLDVYGAITVRTFGQGGTK